MPNERPNYLLASPIKGNSDHPIPLAPDFLVGVVIIMNPSPDPLTLAVAVAAGRIDADAREWLKTSMALWLAGEPLEAAFRLSPSYRVRARDQALRRAAALLAGGSRWDTAKRLSAAVRRHAAHVRPILAKHPEHEVGPIDQALRVAFASGCRVPTTARNLWQLLP